MRIDVGADAEGEDADVGTLGLLHLLDQRIFAGFTDGGQPVGEEDHQVWAARDRPGGAAQRHRLVQRLADGGAADRLEPGDEFIRLRQVRLVRRHQGIEDRFGLGRKPDDLETVVFIQVRQAEAQGLFRLVQLGSDHRARGIEDKADVLRLRFYLDRGHARRCQQHEIAVGARLAAAQQIYAERIRLAREDDLEIAVRPRIPGLEADDRPGGAIAPHIGGVAGTVDALQRRRTIDGHLDRDILDRHRAEFLGVERIDVFDQPGIILQQLGVLDLDLLAGIRLDRVDPHLEGIAADILEQRRILHLADDLLIDGAGLVGGQQFGLHHLAVDVHRELVDVGAWRQGKDISPFQAGVVGIVELLVDRGGRHVVLDVDRHPVVGHRQRRELEMAGDKMRRITNDDQPITPHRQPRQQPHRQQPCPQDHPPHQSFQLRFHLAPPVLKLFLPKQCTVGKNLSEKVKQK